MKSQITLSADSKKKILIAASIAVLAMSAVAALPDGYTEREYIASSGTQYIDTGVIPKSTTRVVCDFQYTALPTKANAAVRCGWGSSGTKESFLFGLSSKSNDANYEFVSIVGANWDNSWTGVAADTNRHVFDLKNGAMYFDGTLFSTTNTLGNTAESSQTMYLFAGHVEWNATINYYSSMKIYSCKIYNGETLVRDFVPAVRDSDGVAGLYDAVNSDFYVNSGKGLFTPGPEKSDEGPFSYVVVSAIPEQVVSSIDELLAGVEPAVTVSNTTTQAELVLGKDYTLAYFGNTSIGTANVVITGIGDYEGYTRTIGFAITGLSTYYAITGPNDGDTQSSVSGTSSAVGWASSQGGTTVAVRGITAANSVYYIWANKWMRTPPRVDFATPPTTAIIVEPSCVWTLGDKLIGQTLTLSNVLLKANSSLTLSPIGDGSSNIRSNTIGGTFELEEGASIRLNASNTGEDKKQYVFSGAVSGTGAIVAPSASSSAAYSTVLLNQITGDISGFTGDIETYNGGTAVAMELVNPKSLPGDPDPEDVSYVVVTNGATLIVDNDWVSPTNRIWILGDSGTPTINVRSGVTLTIESDLVGTVGFNKTGAGTLVLKGASDGLAGKITIFAGEVRLSGKAAALSSDEDIIWAEKGGLFGVDSLFPFAIPDQTVNSLEELAAGIKPSVTVSNLTKSVELVLGKDYTVSYSDNTAYGIATATITGINDYAGASMSKTFIIHAIKEVASSYALSGNEDWTAFESVNVAAGVVVDLKGHNLTISGLDGEGTITDSVGGGKLHFNVPATFASGYEANISSVSLTGGLKLVKEGAGLLVCSKSPQTYTGGTEVLEGVLRAGPVARMTDVYYFGLAESNGSNDIYVGPNGVFDPAGCSHWDRHLFTVAGGMISNTVANTSTSFGAFTARINFTADSTFATTADYGWTLFNELNGYTITVDIANGRTLYLTTASSVSLSGPGSLNVVQGGWLRTYSSRNASIQAVDLVGCNAALYLDGPMSVNDYEPLYPYNYGRGSGVLSVYGTFTPTGSYFYGPTMQDGSAIDLSAKTGAWNLTSSLTYGGNARTRFASGAKVAILLGERQPSFGERIIAWTTATKPADTVSMTNATYSLRSNDDGLYIESLRTFVAVDLPDLAVASTASDIESAIESSLAVTNFVTGGELKLGVDYTYSYVIEEDRCIVTVTGLGANEGVAVEREFTIEKTSFNRSAFTRIMTIKPAAGMVTSPLTNFPVLVRLSESGISGFRYADCKKDDIRFGLADGTPLAHEVDYWNENGESTIWVNVPELTSSTVIRAYWGVREGQSHLPSVGNKAWPDYVGVWHFSEESGIVHDSSGNGYDSSNDGNGTVSNVNAKVGLARNVNFQKGSFGTGVYDLTASSAAKPISDVSKFTVSGWMYSTVEFGDGKYPNLIRKGLWSLHKGWFAQFEASPTNFVGVGTGETRTLVDLETSVYTNWVHMTVVYDGTTCTIYQNGEIQGSSGTINKVSNSDDELKLAENFVGRIDEYRIHNAVVSAAYVAADYATQNNPEFLDYSSVISTVGLTVIVR